MAHALAVLGNIYDNIRGVLDVLVLAFILYKAYEILIKTNGILLLKAVVILAIAYVIAVTLQLSALLWILNVSTQGLLIGFFVVFQPELRKIFLRLGQTQWFWPNSKKSKHMAVNAVLIAAETLSRKRRGMLAVFAGQTDMSEPIKSGTEINAKLVSSLLITIFEYDTPLHDGAVIIKGGKLIAAGCFLPLSEQMDIKKTFGTRHRAALGLSEQTDAIILVVSEETGAISLAYESRLYYDLTLDQIRKKLETYLDLTEENFIEEVQKDEEA